MSAQNYFNDNSQQSGERPMQTKRQFDGQQKKVVDESMCPFDDASEIKTSYREIE